MGGRLPDGDPQTVRAHVEGAGLWVITRADALKTAQHETNAERKAERGATAAECAKNVRARTRRVILIIISKTGTW